jgi:hypothetical protein
MGVEKTTYEDLTDLYFSPNIIQVINIKKNEMDRACSMYGEVHKGFGLGNLREKQHLEDPRIEGKIISRWIFRKWDGEAWAGSSWFRIETGGGRL